MDFAEAFRKAVGHLTRKTKFYGFYEYRVLEEVGRSGSTVQGDARLTLQIVTKLDGLPDLLQMEKAHGSPAATEVCRPSSLVLVGFKGGDPGQPFVGHYLASTPIRAYVDATNEIKIGPSLVGGATIAMGSGPQQSIALAPATISAFQAVETFSIAVVTFADAVGLAVPPLAAAATAVATAQLALSASLSTLLGSSPAGLSSARTSSD